VCDAVEEIKSGVYEVLLLGSVNMTIKRVYSSSSSINPVANIFYRRRGKQL
jgi:hypothetical protein